MRTDSEAAALIDFRPIQFDRDYSFVQDMFLGRAFENAPDAIKRQGLNRFREAWLQAPAATTLMHAFEASLDDNQTIAEAVVVDRVDAGVIWATIEADPGEPPFAQLRLVGFYLRYQRQGLGRIAVQRVEALILERGIATLRSTGNAPSPGIRRFHESLGFEPIQTVFEKRLQTRN